MVCKGLGPAALLSVDILGQAITKTSTCEETGAKDSKRSNSLDMTFSISLMAKLFRLVLDFYLMRIATFVLALFYTLHFVRQFSQVRFSYEILSFLKF